MRQAGLSRIPLVDDTAIFAFAGFCWGRLVTCAAYVGCLARGGWNHLTLAN